MEEKKVNAEADHWRELYEGLTARVKELEAQTLRQSHTIEKISVNLVNAQSAVDINKNIMKNALDGYNRKEQDYVVVINKLKAKLKELGYVDFRGLGV